MSLASNWNWLRLFFEKYLKLDWNNIESIQLVRNSNNIKEEPNSSGICELLNHAEQHDVIADTLETKETNDEKPVYETKKLKVLLKRLNYKDTFLNSDLSNTTDDADSLAEYEKSSKAKKMVKNKKSVAQIFQKSTKSIIYTYYLIFS